MMTAVHGDNAMLTAGSFADEINDFPSAKLIGSLGDMSAFSEDGESDRDSGVGASLLNTSLHWSSGESSEDELPAIGCRCLLHFGIGNQDDFDDGYADNSDVDFDRDLPVGEEGSDNVPVLKGNGDEDELDGRRYHGKLKYLRRSRTAFGSLPVRSRNLRPHICHICSRVITQRDCCELAWTPVYITDPSPEAENSKVDFGLILQTCTYRKVQRHFALIESIGDSLAENFEIKTGDELLMVGNKLVVDVDPTRVASYFQEFLVGDEISLTFRRLLDDVDENDQPLFEFVKSYGEVVGETYPDGEFDTGDSESESGDAGYIVREEKSYICRVRPGTFVLTNPDRLVKQIDSFSDNQRSMAFRNGSFTMDTGYAGDEQKFSINMLIRTNFEIFETRYQFSHVSDESHNFLMAEPPAVTYKDCDVMDDGCPLPFDVEPGMWFHRAYRSTDTHLYMFRMVSQPDYYLATVGGQLVVHHLPGDQSENEDIRFVVNDGH